MVQFLGDGGISGFDAASAQTAEVRYLLATPGMVDVQGITRLQYPLNESMFIYPGLGIPVRDYLIGRANIRFSANDFSGNTGRRLTLSMFVVEASEFAPGVKPSLSAILALKSKVIVRRAVASYTAPGDYAFTMRGPGAGVLKAGTKYWVALAPTAVKNMNLPANVGNDRPINNTVYRGISIWTNRTPKAPTITSPLNGATTPAGGVLTFSFISDDDDRILGNAATLYADRAGLQVQYAPKPSPANPNPVWRDLPIANSAGTATGPGRFLSQSGPEFNEGAGNLNSARTMPLVCGGTDLVALGGYLPSGNWQLRMRTFDFGHPYPTFMRPFAKTNPNFTIADAPASNTSPWSAPVSITISTRVPAPRPMAPVNGAAVPEDKPVNLTWQYRNTFSPPFPQKERVVEIRKVGDPDWDLLVSGPGSSPTVTVLHPDATPTVEYMPDPGFESDTLGDWSVSGNDAAYLEVVGGTVHEGERALRVATSGTETPVVSFYFDATKHDVFAFEGWLRPPSDTVDLRLWVTWFHKDGSYTNGGDFPLPAAAVSWRELASTMSRPATATVGSLSITADSGSMLGLRLDDFSLRGSNSNVGLYPLEAGTQYQWRVRVTDTGGGTAALSDYSEPATFWVVPAPVSGNIRPVPSRTIDGAALGCGTHRVQVYRRGGKTFVGELTNLSSVDWNRVRDDISTAKIVVSGWGIDCGNLLAKLQSWAYEVVIFRDNGFVTERVWEGPITLLTYEVDSVTIQAKDVMALAYRRIIKQPLNDSGKSPTAGATVVDRATRVLQNALAPDDPNVLAYLTPLARPDDAEQYRSLPPYSRTAFEEVDDMAANAGLDYTVVGRSILLWGTKHRIGTLPEFRDNDLGAPPIVSEYGMSMANGYAVSDGNGVWGEAVRGRDEYGNDETYGLVEMLSSTWASDSEDDTGTYTEAGLETIRKSFAEYAERSIADRYPPPVVVRVPDNTTLNPSTVLSIQQLVPGVAIPLRSTGTLRPVVATQKLDKVQVTEQAGSEVISITLSPFSRDDVAVVEGAE